MKRGVKKVNTRANTFHIWIVFRKAKKFWKIEGRVKGRHVYFAQIIICY